MAFHQFHGGLGGHGIRQTVAWMRGMSHLPKVLGGRGGPPEEVAGARRETARSRPICRPGQSAHGNHLVGSAGKTATSRPVNSAPAFGDSITPATRRMAPNFPQSVWFYGFSYPPIHGFTTTCIQSWHWSAPDAVLA